MIARLIRSITLLLLVLAASCSSLIGSDDYEGAGSALCSTLSLCYGIEDCAERIDDRLDRAPAALRQQWLERFTDFDCLGSCAAARRCLDLEPVCAKKGGCNSSEDCCGFVKGKASCGKDSNPQNCCVTRGSECIDDSDCCDAPCLPAAIDKTTCGGVVCREAGEPCAQFFECCSGICKDGSCAEEVCGQRGFPCVDPLDCCSGLCESGLCAEPACPQTGEECNDDCCDGSACVQSPVTGQRLCTEPACELLPKGAECLLDEQCCTGHCNEDFGKCAAPCPVDGQPCLEQDCCEGVCDPSTGQCKCQEFGQSCDAHADCCNGRCDFSNPNGPTCACSTDLCNTNEDCCSGTCIGKACTLECVPPQNIVCHDVCSLGGPLNATVCVDPPNAASCIAAVCTKDEFCCCQAWDDVCINLAATACTDGCK